MSSRLLVSLAAGLISTSALAQTNYALYFNPGISGLLADDEKPLNFGPQQQLTDDNGCNVTYAEDSAIVCFLSTSCSANSGDYPFCALAFTGPSGLALTDVAFLQTLPETSGGSTLRVIPGIEGSERVSAKDIYEASRNR